MDIRIGTDGGTRTSSPSLVACSRTVLFTDVVDSTGRVCELGDRSWTDVLRTHHARFRDRLSLFGGREVDAAGTGFPGGVRRPHARGGVRVRVPRGRRRPPSRGPHGRPHGRVRARGRQARGRRGPRRRPPGEPGASRRGPRVLHRARRGRRERTEVRRPWFCTSCAASPGSAGCSPLCWDESGAFTAGAPGTAADGGGCHAPQAPGTAREHGRRGMMGSRVRDRPGPRAYLSGAAELERVAPARAVGRVLERLEPSGLAPRQEHRQPRGAPAPATGPPGPDPPPDHRHGEAAPDFERLAPLGGLGRHELPVPDEPDRDVEQERLARRLPRPPERPPLLPSREVSTSQHSSFPRLTLPDPTPGWGLGESATCRSSSWTTRRRARFCSSRSSSRASNENAHTLNRTAPAPTRRTHSAVSRARLIDLRERLAMGRRSIDQLHRPCAHHPAHLEPVREHGLRVRPTRISTAVRATERRPPRRGPPRSRGGRPWHTRHTGTARRVAPATPGHRDRTSRARDRAIRQRSARRTTAQVLLTAANAGLRAATSAADLEQVVRTWIVLFGRIACSFAHAANPNARRVGRGIGRDVARAGSAGAFDR